MKRLIAFLCICVLMLGLAACGASENQTTVENKQDNTVNQAEAKVEELPQNETEITEPASSEATVSFEEIIVVDNAECTIKVTGIDKDNMWGYTLKVFLENKSADKTFMYSIISAAVNGVDSDPMFATEVAAGKKSNEEITFMSDDLDIAGIDDFTDIELNFRVYDTNDWATEDVAQASIHVYPYGEENAVRFTRTGQAEDIVLVDNEYATVIVTGCEWDDIWGYSVCLFIDNKSNSSIMVTADEVSVNGYMVDPFYADSISAGNCGFSSISWFEDDLAENGITDIENIEFILRGYDENNWMADDLFNTNIILTP